MADAQALGYGSAFGVDVAGGSSFTDIAGVIDIDSSASRDSVDATNQDSAAMVREFRAGLIDNGEFTITGHFFYDGASQINALRTLFERDVTSSQVVGQMRMTFFTSDGGNETAIFAGFPTSRDLNVPLEDMQEFTVTIKVTGAITWS